MDQRVTGLTASQGRYQVAGTIPLPGVYEKATKSMFLFHLDVPPSTSSGEGIKRNEAGANKQTQDGMVSENMDPLRLRGLKYSSSKSSSLLPYLLCPPKMGLVIPTLGAL